MSMKCSTVGITASTPPVSACSATPRHIPASAGVGAAAMVSIRTMPRKSWGARLYMSSTIGPPIDIPPMYAWPMPSTPRSASASSAWIPIESGRAGVSLRP